MKTLLKPLLFILINITELFKWISMKKDGDIILTLGAGNIVRISNEYARKLQNG